MKKITNYILFSYLLTFIFMFNANAECSYEERKNMLNIAKNVDISIVPIEVSEEDGTYDFKFIVTGLTDDIFIKYYNTNNGIESYISYSMLENGIYSYIDENSISTYDYKFIFYSNNNNCLGNDLYTKTLKKPMYNIYSENINCKNDANEDFKYCKRFLEKDYNLTLEKFNVAITEYNLDKVSNEVVVDEKKIDTKIIIFSVLGLIFLVLIIFIIFLIRKKRREL